jgi:L-aspartate oxidase
VAVDLLRVGGRVVGVLTRAHRPSGRAELIAWLAPAVVLATGGYAHLWAATTTPAQAVGDGVAMAARAGAALADLEFVQFHPTALAGGQDPAPLITEALRGEGAVLVDETGRRFTFDAHPAGELAPRDVVARAIYAHLQGGHEVFLDAREAVGDRFPDRFPTVFEQCRRVGIDPRREPVPVSPAAHYCMGGIVTDGAGRTSLPGLWAAGEVAATGLHGANRLASNSLLEGVVMGRAVAADIAGARSDAARPAAARPASPSVDPRAACDPAAAGTEGTGALGPEVLVPADALGLEEADPAGVVAEVRRVLWANVGLVRDADGLRRARREVAALAGLVGPSRPARNAVLLAGLVVEAALARAESRGAHWRIDHPLTGSAPVRRTVEPTSVHAVPLVIEPAVAA